MGRLIAWVLLLSLPTACIAASSLSAKELTPSEIFDRASLSIVVVNGLDGDGVAISQGSGVVIEFQKVISNCHVLKSAQKAEAIYRGTRFPATLVDADTKRDLCSLSVPSLMAPAAKIGQSRRLRVGERVLAIGAPRGFELTLSDGIVSSFRKVAGGELLQVTTPISPGSSGGGLFDTQGNLVGITTLYWADSPQINFALPVEWVAELPMSAAAIASSATRAQESADAAAAAADAVMAGAATDSDAAADATDRATAEKEARRELDKLGEEFAAADPVRYAKNYDTFLRNAKEVIRTLPPSDWVAAARREYYAIPSPVKSQDQRWVRVNASDEHIAYIDTETLMKYQDTVKVWVRTEFDPAIKFEGVSGISMTMSLQIFNCKSKVSSSSETIAYSKNGAVLGSTVESGLLVYGAIIPGSLSELISRLVCQ